MRRALVILLGLTLAACAGRSTPSPTKSAVVTFDANVSDAEVWIDGRFVPGVLERGVRLPPGTHRIEIRHDDYHAQYIELTLEAGERRVLEAELAEILP